MTHREFGFVLAGVMFGMSFAGVCEGVSRSMPVYFVFAAFMAASGIAQIPEARKARK